MKKICKNKAIITNYPTNINIYHLNLNSQKKE